MSSSPLCAAFLGPRATYKYWPGRLACVRGARQRELRKLKSSERKYKRLLAWAPLSAWVRAVETEDDDDDDASSAAAR